MKSKILLTAVPFFLLSGCTSIQVDGVEAKSNLDTVCIETNPKVFSGFENDLVSMIHDRGYRTKVYQSNGKMPDGCNVFMHYTAKRSWDVVTYLAYAELKMFDLNGYMIGQAEYSHGGGFDFSKWRKTKTKLTPVVEQLLPKRITPVGS